MVRKGLLYETIIKTAVTLTEEKGFNHFSLRELAAKLQVQPSSLYNHVKGIKDIQKGIGLYGIDQIEKGLTDASDNKDMTAALKDMGLWYRSYAKENPELYQAVIGLQMSEDEELRTALKRIVAPFIKTLALEVKDKDKIIHLERACRSMLHGFISLEMSGYMNQLEIGQDESFDFMLDHFINSIKKEGEGSGRQSRRAL